MNDDLQQAKDNSRECPFCGGEGMATVFHRDYDGQPYVMVESKDGYRRTILRRASAYCACLFGQAIARNHQETAKDVFSRSPNLRVIMADPSSRWSTDDPTEKLDESIKTWADVQRVMRGKPIVQSKPGLPRRKPIVSADNPLKRQDAVSRPQEPARTAPDAEPVF